jgi:hypothetical protein
MKLPSGRGIAKDGKPSLLTRANRFMWTKLPNYEVVVNVPLANDETHQRVFFSISRPYGQVSIDLTALTAVELAALRETFLIATDVARPVVEALDQKARDDEQDGNDNNPRLYRQLPLVVVRKGALTSYSESLLLGREDVLHAVGAQFSAAGSAESESSGVVNGNKDDSVAGDIQATGSESF